MVKINKSVVAEGLPQSKVCRTCKTLKDLDYYSKRKQSKDGLNGECKECDNKHHKKYSASHEEERNKYYRDYHELHREHHLKQMSDYNRANAEKSAEYHRQYRESNMEGLSAYYRDRFQENPNYYKMMGHKRRAAIKGVGGVFSPLKILERCGYICGICYLPIDKDLKFPHKMSLVFDHIVPISKCIEGSNGNDDSNVQPAHLICNSRKSNKEYV